MRIKEKETELFKSTPEDNSMNMPLAARMSPKALEEFTGQEHILGKDKLLRRVIESDRVSSAIFFGPPGTGKSALAKIISNTTKSCFEQANAVTIGVQDIRKIVESAVNYRNIYHKKTILMLDEIHHFNRTQQDALLPVVESGLITLIGLTTENPYFYVNSALISRSLVFEFKPLSNTDMQKIIQNSLTDAQRGLGKHKVDITGEALKHIITYADGDARKALNAVEVGVLTTKPGADGVINFDLTVAEESIQRRSITYDKSSDQHYDHISAFIKSMRGSDPDAAIYWMTKMLKAGEDPRFVVRRIVIAASEDVGNADPNALVVAIAALNAVDFVGMPEARIPLAQAAIYVATAPKSNASYMALNSATEEIQNGVKREVPNHLKDASVDSKGLGHGEGYLYPHSFEGHFVKQEYMPDFKVFYEPSGLGYEEVIKKRLDEWRKKTKV